MGLEDRGNECRAHPVPDLLGCPGLPGLLGADAVVFQTDFFTNPVE